jgi:hypothetical protein
MPAIGPVRSVFVLVSALGVFAARAGSADERDVVAAWKLSYEPVDGRTHEPILIISKAGSDPKGEWAEDDKKSTVKDLQFKDGKLRFRWEGEYNGEAVSVTYEGQLKGDNIEVEGRWMYQGMSGSFPFTGKRGAAQTKALEAREAAVPKGSSHAAKDAGAAGKDIPIWPGVAPGSEGWECSERAYTAPPGRGVPAGSRVAMDVVRPVLLHYPAEKAKAVGAAMIVAPGGGFRALMMSYEGADIARRLSAVGIDAFILKYRLLYTGPGAPSGQTPPPAERPRRFTVTGASRWSHDRTWFRVVQFRP